MIRNSSQTFYKSVFWIVLTESQCISGSSRQFVAYHYLQHPENAIDALTYLKSTTYTVRSNTAYGIQERSGELVGRDGTVRCRPARYKKFAEFFCAVLSGEDVRAGLL